MELNVQDLLQRYNRELSEQTHLRILAEARAAAAEEELETMRAKEQTSGE